MSTTPSQNMSLPALLGGTAALVAVAGLVGFLAPVVYQACAGDLRAERGWNTTPLDTRQARSAQVERLAQYAWIDRNAGVVALPIERAMQLSLEEQRSSKEARR